MDVAGQVLVLVVLGAGVVIASVTGVRRFGRWRRERSAPPTGLQRAGAPDGTDDPAVATRRAQGTMAWTRISGGGF